MGFYGSCKHWLHREEILQHLFFLTAVGFHTAVLPVVVTDFPRSPQRALSIRIARRAVYSVEVRDDGHMLRGNLFL